MTITLTPRSYERVLKHVVKHGRQVSPRGEQTYELINGSMVLRNPLDRLVTNRNRRMNVAFAVAEFFSFIFAVDDINFFTRFISDYGRFSSDGKVLDGCYGTRLKYAELQAGLKTTRSQLDAVVDKLSNDKDSRQAVMTIYQAGDLFGGGGKNTPCTETLQFLVRDGELHMIVNMRSSDLVRGLTYDLYVFTMTQELLARQLGLPLGNYYHNAGSLHVYKSDLELIDQMDKMPRWPHVMTQMPLPTQADLSAFRLMVEDGLDQDIVFFGMANDHKAWSSGPNRVYWVSQAAVMKSFINRHANPELALRAHDLVSDRSLKFVLRQALVRAGIKDKSRLLGV